MAKTYTTTIPEELTTYIQRLFYDVEMRKTIIKEMIRDEGESIRDNENFKFYNEDLSRVNSEYQMANAELEAAVFPKDFVGLHIYDWNLNFSTNIVTATIKDLAGIKKLEAAGYVLK